MDLMRRFISEEEGQNVVEYALVLTLVALACVLGLALAGGNLSNWWNAIGTYVGTLTKSVP